MFVQWGEVKEEEGKGVEWKGEKEEEVVEGEVKVEEKEEERVVEGMLANRRGL